MSLLRRLGRDERGFTMLTVMMVMLVAGLFAVSAYAAAGGDVPLGGQSRDAKRAYAAAEAGVEYYAAHIAANPDYWTLCTTVPTPNPGEPNPVANEWYGPASGADTRTGHWRNVPGGTATYSIELLAAKDPNPPSDPTPQCVVGDQTTMLDPSTGVFRIRSTGRAGTESRSIVASFRRPSFLDFLWFTNFENLDPMVATSDQAWQAANCMAFRPQRNAAAVSGHACSEITFPAGDQLKGPFHSNDSVQFSAGTKVGRPGKNDRLETHQPPTGYSGSPTLYAPWNTNQDNLPIPTSNGDLKPIATTGGKVFTGRTIFSVNGDTVNVTKSDNTTTSFKISDTNGVIYVQNGSGSAPCSLLKSPQIADYGEGPACGVAYISGTYSSSFTLTSDADIVVGTPTASVDLRRSATSDAVAGLIATNFVRVQHRVNRTSTQLNDPNNCTNAQTPRDVYIDAAMLSVAHSFIVDNFNCGGAQVGTLHITGAIAQNFRGRVAGTAVGSGVSAGFIKDYNYDDRLKFRSPPYFLAPLISAWHLIRQNEQVPAR